MASSTQLSAMDSCGPEHSALKRSIWKLENKLLIGTWQVEHFRTHKNFQPFQPAEPESDLVPSVNHNTSGTSDSSDMTQMKPLPPAGNLIVHDKDCSELFDRLRPSSGFYRIRPKSHQDPFLVYCDMEDGGGWTVFQKRRHGKVDFNRYLSRLCRVYDSISSQIFGPSDSIAGRPSNICQIIISETGWTTEMALVTSNCGMMSFGWGMNTFILFLQKDKYRLQYELYSGKAGDALTGSGGMVEQWSTSLSGMQFSTRDQDNDRYLQGSCAQENKAGWWFNRCHAANLNGKFYRSGKYKGQNDNGVVWGTWKGLWYSLRHTTMKVRPLVFLDAMGSGAGDI
ncbi:Fibrinogen-like protein 1 [Collichthys lucidus]|uniref:Fibrinogen-like protein 1 n=1 Tax=Collichthys lucidus TaxID=240159 RepID=A0A4U5V6I9_COLLU|nr:Fibrinogen-like protein 1 [Collichthys lucidus]